MSRLAKHLQFASSVVASSGGGSPDGTGARLQDQIPREISAAVAKIIGYRDWVFVQQRTAGGRTWPKYDTGTITLTIGDTKVLGADGAAFTRAYQHGLLEVTPTGSTLNRPRIRTVDTPTQFQMYHPWPLPTEAGLKYAIYQDTYPLRYDVEAVQDDSIIMHGRQHPLWRIDRQDLNFYLGSQSGFAVGEPQRWIDDDSYDVDLWNDGQVATATKGSDALVGDGAANWTDPLLTVDAPGDVLRDQSVDILIPTLYFPNGIQQVDSDTTLTLARKFQGASTIVGGTDYVFGRAGSPLLTFYPPPTDARAFIYQYSYQFFGLFSADDFCPIPARWDHVVDELAASRILLQYKGSESIRAQAAAHFARFRDALEDMAAKDHPQRDAVGKMEDHALAWDYWGGPFRRPEFTGPQYWRASG